MLIRDNEKIMFKSQAQCELQRFIFPGILNVLSQSQFYYRILKLCCAARRYISDRYDDYDQMYRATMRPCDMQQHFFSW